jgi:hypothetical protein
MKMFLKDRSFHGVMLDRVINSSPELVKNLHNIMTEGILSGFVRPLNRTVFPDVEVEQALRYTCHYRDIKRMT